MHQRGTSPIRIRHVILVFGVNNGVISKTYDGCASDTFVGSVSAVTGLISRGRAFSSADRCLE